MSNESLAGSNAAHALVVNAGSSSIKLTLFDIAGEPKRVFEVAVVNIGQPTARLVMKDSASGEITEKPENIIDHKTATILLVDWLKPKLTDLRLIAIGHRIVHGGPKYFATSIIDEAVLKDLRDLAPFDPEHLPDELVLIDAFYELFPNVPQIACFDTAFHHNIPTVAQLLPIPRRYNLQGIRRYGFHGLSYSFIVEALKRLDDPAANNGRLVIAHMGSGVSLAAVKDGVSIDTTMSFTPVSGVPMGTRSGDLDPGIFLYLARGQNLDPDELDELVNKQSGLLGMSETTADMEQLLKLEATDERAKDAVDVFCYQVKKSIGSLSAALGGLDGLIFTGGMGENAPKVRSRICAGLTFLGVELDEARNLEGKGLISTDISPVKIRVIPTDEALVIARSTRQILSESKVHET